MNSRGLQVPATILPNGSISPREAYARLVAGDVESVSVDKLSNRIAANAIMPYPPGIPMLMSGENFGGADSPQIGYLRGMQNGEQQFPGFAGVIEGVGCTTGITSCASNSDVTQWISRSSMSHW
jgi:arginine decarboxylase